MRTQRYSPGSPPVIRLSASDSAANHGLMAGSFVSGLSKEDGYAQIVRMDLLRFMQMMGGACQMSDLSNRLQWCVPQMERDGYVTRDGDTLKLTREGVRKLLRVVATDRG